MYGRNVLLMHAEDHTRDPLSIPYVRNPTPLPRHAPSKPLQLSGACAPPMNATALADDERVKVDRK